MVLQVRRVADLFDRPDTEENPANIVTTINVGNHILLAEKNRTQDGDWIEVEAGLRPPVDGWVRAADVAEVTDPKPVPVDTWSFVDYCMVASDAFNQRQPTAGVCVDRDYLLALALVLNGLEETDLKGNLPQDFDPFHFTQAEWKEFCDSGSNVSKYQNFDHLDPLAQIDAAVFFTAEWTNEIVHALTNPDNASGPYIPNSIDLFLAHMLGHAGVAALKDNATNGGGASKSWASYVSTAGGDSDALSKRYPKFLGVPGTTTISQVSHLIEVAFDKAYINVAKIVPDGVPGGQPPTGDPGWLTKAKSEEAQNIAEPNSRILEYFKATDFKGATPTTAWCGAFVAFCMNSSGEPVPKGAARAASWADWGQQLSKGTPVDKIPFGAVVTVSHAPGTNEVGHVAFFVGGGEDPSHVRLLGGNQSKAHALNRESFRLSEIVQIRWPAAAAEPAGPPIPAGQIGIGQFTARNWEEYRVALGKRESGNKYDKVNPLGYCGRWQFGASVLDDLGYVHHRCTLRQLADARFWGLKDKINSRDDWLSNHAEQDAALLELTRRNYKWLVKNQVIKSSDPASTVAGYLAAAHLVGCGGARDLAKGIVRHDANQTTSAAYFDLLKTAVA